MRCRELKSRWGRLKQLTVMKLTREELLMRLGVARKQARTAWRLLAIPTPPLQRRRPKPHGCR